MEFPLHTVSSLTSSTLLAVRPPPPPTFTEMPSRRLQHTLPTLVQFSLAAARRAYLWCVSPQTAVLYPMYACSEHDGGSLAVLTNALAATANNSTPNPAPKLEATHDTCGEVGRHGDGGGPY